LSEGNDRKRVPVPIKVGVGLTIILFVMVVYLASIYRCSLMESGTLECRTNLLWFLDAPPNEIGDTIAGVFATLAFVWIVVTVFLQSAELAEQRKELELTRTELQLAREAQEAQLQVMQKQAEIFEDEKKQREWDRIEKVLDGLLVDLARKCELLNDLTTWEFDRHEDDYAGMSDDEFNTKKVPSKESAKPFATVPNSNLDERVHQHARTLMFFYLFALHEGRHLRCSKKVSRKYYTGLDELLEQIIQKSKQASEGQQVRIASLNLESMREHLSDLLKLNLWLPETDTGETK